MSTILSASWFFTSGDKPMEGSFVLAQKGAHLQILFDGKFDKNLSSLRAMNDSFADDLMGGQVVESVALVKNFSFDRHHTGDCSQQGRLAGSIRTHDPDHFIWTQAYTQAVQSNRLAV
jgi:hypothetical protein